MASMVSGKKQKRDKVWTDYECDAWKLPPAGLTVSQWAAENRRLSGRGTAEPGRWRNERTPWAVGIMDSFNESDTEIIVVIKPPQSGGTEAMYNMLGYAIDIDPGPTLMVMPRDSDVEYAAIDRLKPMITESPALAKHMTGRAWDLNRAEFKLDNMDLYFAASNSPAGLASKPIRYVFFDEVDKFPPFAGKEANPIELGIHRTTTFADRKIVLVTTPTYEGNNSWQWWKKSDKRRLFIPCPNCGSVRVWQFSDLKLPKELRDPEDILAADDCWLLCPECEYKIREELKAEMALNCVWQATGKKGKIAGFHYNCLFSPWVDWAKVLAEFFAANTPAGIASGEMMNFKNSREALPWSSAEKSLTAEEVHISGSHKRLSVPNECVIVTAGADYHMSTRHGMRIDYELRGFEPNDKNYVIDSGFVSSFEEFEQGVLDAPLVWQEQCDKDNPVVTRSYIDSGYRPQDVYNFATKHPERVFAIKGMNSRQMQPIRFGRPEAALFKNKKASIPLVLLDVSFFKDLVFGWLENNMTEFYEGLPEYYIKEFTNEVLNKEVSKKGKTDFIWVPKYKGAPTHSLDTAVYATAAAWRLRNKWQQIGKENKKPARKVRQVPARRKKRDSFVNAGGGFLDGIGRVL